MSEHSHKEHGHAHHEKKRKYEGAINVLLIAVFLLVAYNQYLILSISSSALGGSASLSSPNLASSGAASTGDEVQDAINAVIPTGIPAVYGTELGISFDDVGDCKTKGSCFDLTRIDDPNPKNSMTKEQLDRFMKIGNQIGCDYCCGLKKLVGPEGTRPCGCAHSHAMRGLAQYLIKQHGSEYTDEQILGELQKWKALFFPKQSVQAYLQAKGGNANIGNLPSQVGGC